MASGDEREREREVTNDRIESGTAAADPYKWILCAPTRYTVSPDGDGIGQNAPTK